MLPWYSLSLRSAVRLLTSSSVIIRETSSAFIFTAASSFSLLPTTISAQAHMCYSSAAPDVLPLFLCRQLCLLACCYVVHRSPDL